MHLVVDNLVALKRHTVILERSVSAVIESLALNWALRQRKNALRVFAQGIFYKFGLLPKISDCKYASGILPTITDSPTKISVATAKFSVRDGITMLISAIILR